MAVESVLIVDDDADLRHIVALSLRRLSSWRVLVAESGNECLRLADSERPDVILLDLMMPGMDGVAVLARLRERPDTAAIPVVLVTAKARQHEVQRYAALGVAGVIVKPFDPLRLPDQIRRLVEGAP